MNTDLCSQKRKKCLEFALEFKKFICAIFAVSQSIRDNMKPILCCCIGVH